VCDNQLRNRPAGLDTFLISPAGNLTPFWRGLGDTLSSDWNFLEGLTLWTSFFSDWAYSLSPFAEESLACFTFCTRAFDMDWIYGLTSIVTLGLAIYLTVALLKPELFS
jgi:K+-transporting ATPase KdpF subunit